MRVIERQRLYKDFCAKCLYRFTVSSLMIGCAQVVDILFVHASFSRDTPSLYFLRAHAFRVTFHSSHGLTCYLTIIVSDCFHSPRGFPVTFFRESIFGDPFRNRIVPHVFCDHATSLTVCRHGVDTAALFRSYDFN